MLDVKGVQILGKRSSRSRKGLSTAVGTAFFIIVVIISMSAIWALSSFQARYQGVTDQMNAWDTQRISENLNIRNVDNTTFVEQFGTHKLNYNFSITVDNNGGETLNIVRIYVYNQSAPTNETSKRLWIYNPINASAMQPRSGLNHSNVNTGEVAHVIAVNGTKFRGSFRYRIILTTDRGRQFSYSYPPSGGAGGGGYALVIDDSHNNFQYAVGADTTFKSAYVKQKAGDPDVLYRVLIKNTTGKKIFFWNNCSMVQTNYAGGANTIRYPVANTSTSVHLVAFSSQTVNSNSSQYLYFAAESPGTAQWMVAGDPTKASYYFIGLIIAFEYEGETTVRHFGLPPLTQQLT